VSYDCTCDYDPPTFYERSTPTARKQHKCYECADVIDPGEKYERAVGLWEGYFSEFKTCQACVDIRQWVKNNVPCLCWSHGNTIEDCREAVDEAAYRAPEETVGLRFGLLRRIVQRDKAALTRGRAA
jgi:hypothetical protein